MSRVYLCALALCVAIFGTALVSTTGCGSKQEQTVWVSGTVQFNGQPLKGATVTFQCDGANKNYSDTTDENGKYRFKSAVGESHVSVAKVDASGGPQTPDDFINASSGKVKSDGGRDGNADAGKQSDMKKKMDPNKHLVPKKYSVPGTSGLTASVKKGVDNVFDFKLDEAPTAKKTK